MNRIDILDRGRFEREFLFEELSNNRGRARGINVPYGHTDIFARRGSRIKHDVNSVRLK